MWESILNIIAGYSVTAFLFVVVAVIVWLVARFYFTRFKKTEERVSDLPCKQHEVQYEKLSNKMDKLGMDINSIMLYLSMKSNKAAGLFSVKHSPRKLNEAGEDLYKDFDGESFLNNNKKLFLDAIAAKNPKTALDVEVAASEVLFENLQNDIFNGLKNWVYNSPTRKIKVNGQEQDYNVTINDVVFIMSLPLRDMYLKAHPEVA